MLSSRQNETRRQRNGQQSFLIRQQRPRLGSGRSDRQRLLGRTTERLQEESISSLHERLAERNVSRGSVNFRHSIEFEFCVNTKRSDFHVSNDPINRHRSRNRNRSKKRVSDPKLWPNIPRRRNWLKLVKWHPENEPNRPNPVTNPTV